jgi:hypothetical protein
VTDQIDMRRTRIAAACGVLFTGLVVAGGLLITLGQPSGDHVSDARIVHYLTDHKDQLELAGGPIGALALLCLLVYLGGLRDTLVRADGEGGRRSSIVVASGVAAGVLMGLMFVFSGLIAGALDYAKPYKIDPNTARTIGGLQFWCALYASVPAIVMIGSAALTARRSGAFPRWLGTAGLVAAVLTGMVSIVGFPIGIPALALWVLATSVVMLVRSRAPRTAPSRAPRVATDTAV